MSLLSSLKRDQKEAIFLLQIGTFLEYFDLMLYVHMAVLLNELFFPKTDPHTAALLTAFAFCSTYVMRPIGALVFGYIGDNVGRKTTVILTTLMMSISCLIMASLPTYAQIGITAAWVVTLCRVFQGFSSMGEVIGASLYLTEITKPPIRYMVVSSIGFFSALGPAVALAIASLVTTQNFNWRWAFWFGAAIALVGSIARTRLRETPDFVDMKRRMAKAIEDANDAGLTKAAELLKSTNNSWKEKVSMKTTLAYFLMQSGWPVFFYFTYIYCGSLLKTQFGYNPGQIIHQNFVVSLFQLLSFLIITIACKWVHPLTILKVRSNVLYLLVLVFPFVLTYAASPMHIFIMQVLCISFTLSVTPAYPLFIIHFPVYRRFTYDSFIYALSRALIYITTSFGLVYVTEFFSYFGLWVIMAPTCIGFYWGARYFEKLGKLKESSGDKHRMPMPLRNYARLKAAGH